ncbi:MAG TPA: hypothetical protein VF995_10100 [Actinomycetota bacterium]
MDRATRRRGSRPLLVTLALLLALAASGLLTARPAVADPPGGLYPDNVYGPGGACCYGQFGTWFSSGGLGLKGRAVWTWSNGATEDSHAQWDAPNLDENSPYTVDAFIPHNFATAKAHYVVSGMGASQEVVRDQNPVSDNWLNLGQFCPDTRGHLFVRLTDRGDPAGSTQITADAMRFTRVPGGQCAHQRPVLLVRGINVTTDPGGDVKAYWGPLPGFLANHGWTNLHYIAYYHHDVNGDFIPNYGRTVPPNNGEYNGGSACTPGATSTSPDLNCSLRHIAWNLAWYIYRNWSSKNIDVRIAAHSQGGLITRWMLYRVQNHDPAFPPSLLVSNVVTLGTPHSGAWLAAVLNTNPPILATQINELLPPEDPNGGFTRELNNNAKHPNAANGTDWTLIASEAFATVDSGNGLPLHDGDQVVTAARALGGMDNSTIHRVVYMAGASICHPGPIPGGCVRYVDAVGTSLVPIKESDMGAPWTVPGPGIQVGPWTDNALFFRTW